MMNMDNNNNNNSGSDVEGNNAPLTKAEAKLVENAEKKRLKGLENV